MKEVEVKILDVDRALMEKKLLALGAKKVYEEELDGINFNASVELLRLRKVGKKAFLTLKTDKVESDVKSVDEFELEVGDFDVMRQILSLLGFEERSHRRKRRIHYECGSIHVEFDKMLGQLDFVPEFMEVEAHSREELVAFLEKIGLSLKDTVTWTNREVIEYYS